MFLFFFFKQYLVFISKTCNLSEYNHYRVFLSFFSLFLSFAYVASAFYVRDLRQTPVKLGYPIMITFLSLRARQLKLISSSGACPLVSLTTWRFVGLGRAPVVLPPWASQFSWRIIFPFSAWRFIYLGC